MNTGEMIELFRNYVNERPYDSDTGETTVFWKRADILQYLNMAQIHYNAIVIMLDESYGLVYHDYLPADVDSVEKSVILPADCQKIKLLELFTSNSDFNGIEILPIHITEKFRLNMIYPNRYYLFGNQIKFKPELDTSWTKCRLYYYYRLPQLANDDDVCQLPQEVHENIVIYAVKLGLLRDKQASLANYWAQILKDKDAFLANVIVPRQAQVPNTVLPRLDWEAGIYGLNVGF